MIAQGQQTLIWRSPKERRFTGTARVLGGKLGEKATVEVISQKGGAPAWCSPSGKIVINDAVPAQRTEKLSLIWERAKLYHEILHLLYTSDDDMRRQLAGQSSDPQKYLWISNALEDGRIEYHGGKLYQGITWYIRVILKELVRENSAASGLLIYVRTKMWRNPKEEAFWKKYEAQIDSAITAGESSVVWLITKDIVEDMEAQKPKPKPQPEPDDDSKINVQPSDDQQSAEDEQGEADEPEEGQDSGEESEDDTEASGGAPDFEDEGGGEEQGVESEGEGED